MEQSIFNAQLLKYLPAFIVAWEKDMKGQEYPYLHDIFLPNKRLSRNGTFGSINVSGATPMAGAISYDSPTPVISQQPTSIITGDIPKIGVKNKFNEQELTELMQLVNDPTFSEDADVLLDILRPLYQVYKATKERWEFMFKQAVSTGKVDLDPTNNTGTGVLVDFGFKAQNKIKATAIWTTAGVKPFTDINRLAALARKDQKRAKHFLMDEETFNILRTSDEAKSMVFPMAPNLANTPTITEGLFNQVFKSEYGATITLVQNNQILERDGVQTELTAWKKGQIAMLVEDNIGALVWARLAEDLGRVNGVDYSTIETCILLSQFKRNEPYGVYNSAQTRSLPVIKNNIYLLDTTVKA